MLLMKRQVKNIGVLAERARINHIVMDLIKIHDKHKSFSGLWHHFKRAKKFLEINWYNDGRYRHCYAKYCVVKRCYRNAN